MYPSITADHHLLRCEGVLCAVQRHHRRESASREATVRLPGESARA